MRCKRCKEDKNLYARGFCKGCYHWYYYHQHNRDTEFMTKKRAYARAHWQKRYHGDPEFRERKKKLARKYFRKKCRDDPDFNAKKQREFRKKHPDSYNYLMARYYFRKLSAEKRKRLLEEVKK